MSQNKWNQQTAPTIEHTDDSVSDYVETHPSYALVTMSRISGSTRTPLFGSSIVHNEMVSLRVSVAEKHRANNRDWFFPKKEIIEVWMSPAQFAEAITHLNHGSGTPATLRHIEGNPVPFPMYTDRKRQFHQEFQASMGKLGEKFSEVMKQAKTLLQKPNKTGMKELLGKLEYLRMHIESNLPFVANQFNEQMESTVTEAKAEVDSFVTRVIQDAGLKSLSETMLPQLPDSGTSEKDDHNS